MHHLFLFTELGHNVFKMLYICVGMSFLNQVKKKIKEFNQQQCNCLCKVHKEYNVCKYDMNQKINRCDICINISHVLQ